MNNQTSNRIHSWILLPLVLLCISGIGRHDIGVAKYCERAKNPEFGCVGELCVNGRFVSSCVLAHKRYIITTAHSVFKDSWKQVRDSIQTPLGMKPVKRAAYTQVVNAGQITIRIGTQKIRGVRLFVHPLYADSFRSEELYDVAVLELEKEVPDVMIAEMYNGDMLHKQGIAVGCGEVSTADDYTGKKSYKRQKMAGENMIDSTTTFRLWADMDHPDLPGFNRMGSAAPLPFEWIGSGGDCGSPLFVHENGKYYLAGISFSPASYDDMYYFGKLKGTDYGFITGWTKISAVREWVDGVIKK